MKGDNDWLAFVWIPSVVIILTLVLTGWNPAKLLNMTSESPSTTVPADCINYKNRVDQQQAEIDRLNQDLSSCKNENTCGFSWLAFFMGMIIAGIGAFFLFQWVEKKHGSRLEKLNDAWIKDIEKLKKKRKK